MFPLASAKFGNRPSGHCSWIKSKGFAKRAARHHDVKPLIKNLTDMTAEASRAVTLATAQVERADRLFGDLALSAERTMAIASQFVGGPAKNGFALFAAARAAFSAFRELRVSSRRRQAYRSPPDDEESLFIG